jgi:Trehalose utilisation
LKSIRPELALVTWTTNAGRFGHFRDIPRNMPARMNLLLDAPDQEFWLDETNRGATVVPAFANAYAWAVTNHRVAFSEPYLMSHGNPYGKDSFPAHEIERRMMLALTHGAVPSLAVGQPAHLQEPVYRLLEKVRKLGSWLTNKEPEPWAALVMSDNTRVFYGRDPGLVEERYLASVFGFFRAALEEHLPLTLINDWNLTPAELAKYKVLILANTACLDETQCAAIRGFVERGGGLVASLDTSLCNEFGDTRENFALADVLGVDYRGVPTVEAAAPNLDVNFAHNLPAAYWEKRKGAWDFQHSADSMLDSPRLRELIGTQSVTFKGQTVKVAPREKAEIVGTLLPKSGAKVEPVAAIVTHTYGRGRVVYFGAGIDAANYLYAYPYERVLLEKAIEWAAAEPAPVKVDAPMCVHAVAMRQKREGTRVIVQLFNDLNTTAFHARPDDDVPLREETIPIHDLRITFRGYHIRRVHFEPQQIELQPMAAPDETTVVVPTLEIYGAVVAELDD